jgi:Tol biopolymer transport system component
MRSPTRTVPTSPTLTTRSTSAPMLVGQIVFSSKRDGNYEIYIMNPDGTQQTRLTYTEANEQHPVGSPDGKFIAFSASYEGDEEIYRMQIDGSDITRLTTSLGNDWGPAWSPDGNWLVFASQRDKIEGYEGPPPELYVINNDGSGLRRLTNNTTSDSCASWSPDMLQIAFSSFRYDFDFVRLMVLDSDGTVAQLPLVIPEDAYCPVWSPDGQQIAFNTADVQNGNGDIWMVYPDGTGLHQLSPFDLPARFRGVRWSPDGQWLVFSADTGSGYDVYRSTLDGQVVNLTPLSVEDDGSPSWIP